MPKNFSSLSVNLLRNANTLWRRYMSHLPLNVALAVKCRTIAAKYRNRR
jgi:hypothetical protein